MSLLHLFSKHQHIVRVAASSRVHGQQNKFSQILHRERSLTRGLHTHTSVGTWAQSITFKLSSALTFDPVNCALHCLLVRNKLIIFGYDWKWTLWLNFFFSPPVANSKRTFCWSEWPTRYLPPSIEAYFVQQKPFKATGKKYCSS